MAERRIVLHFPKELLDQPVISTMLERYKLRFNILRADITPDEEGLMVLGLEGTEQDLDGGIQWMTEQGVQIQPLERDVVRDEDTCTHCGACINICPTEALTMHAESREVSFDPDDCVACGLCVPVCPPRAMSVSF